MLTPTSLILLYTTSLALPVFSNLHIRLMNPVVQIGKIKIAPPKYPTITTTTRPPNVLQLLYCQRYYHYSLSAHKIFCT